MKAKEIILLILIVTVGIIFYHAQTGKIWIDWDWDDGVFLGQEEFVYEETEEIAPPFPQSLRIMNAHGQVEVQGSEQEIISVTFQKQIFRRNQTRADEVADELRMVIEKNGPNIQISTNRGEFRKRRFRTNFKVVVPKEITVYVKNSYGEVRVYQAGETEIDNPSGRVYASDISGNLTVKNSYKDVEIEKIGADCRIDSNNANVAAIDVEGNAFIDHRYGKIHLENIGQSATVDGSYTAVHGENVLGLCDIRTSYRRIDLSDVGAVKIRSNNSRIEIKGAKDFVDIENKYGKLELFDIDGNLRVDGKNLEVFGHSIIGEEILISTSYRKVELINFQGKTEITHSNGDVGLEPLSISSPIVVKGRYTDILFYWQSGWRYPIEARAKEGKVVWNVSEGLSHEEENGYRVIRAFESETDKPAIRLDTTYGSIKIDEY
jgi:hypothetical protein